MDPVRLWYELTRRMEAGQIGRREADEYLEANLGISFAQLEGRVNETIRGQFSEDYRGLPRSRGQIRRGSPEATAFQDRFDAYLAQRGIPSMPYLDVSRSTDPFNPVAAAIQGATFEWGDEILGAIGLEGLGNYLESEAEASYEHHPVMTGIADFGTGFLTGAGAVRAGAKLAGKAPAALQWLLRGPADDVGTFTRAASHAAREATLGGVGGALHGAGAGGEDDTRAASALMYGLVGGAGGAILPTGFRVGRGAYNRLIREPGSARRMAGRAEEILPFRAGEDPVMAAERAEDAMRPIYQQLEEQHAQITDPKIESLFNEMWEIDETRRFIPRGTVEVLPEAPFRTDPYVHKVEEIIDLLDVTKFPEESKRVKTLLSRYQSEVGLQGSLDLPDTAPVAQRIDPNLETGAALVKELSESDNPVIRDVVRMSDRGLTGKPGVPRDRPISFNDVQSALGGMRATMMREGQATSPAVISLREQLEDAMADLDPKFRNVQRQWRANRHMAEAKLAGEESWKTPQYWRTIRQDLDRFTRAGDDEAKEAYVASMFGNIMENMRFADRNTAGRALRFLLNDAPDARRLIEEVLTEVKGIDGKEMAAQLARAADSERLMNAAMNRLQSIGTGMAAGTSPRRAFVYGIHGRIGW